MCRRNIRESLTARIFLLTLLLLLGAGGLTFGLIAWATPITYVSVVGDRLQVQVSELTDRLALTKLADAGPILDVFVRESGAAVSLASPDGESVDTGSLYVSVTTAVQESDSVSTYTYGADGGPAQRERAGHYVTTALSDALIAEVTFADRAETYQLLVVPPMRLANQAVEALNRAAPCLALALLAFSLLCAVGYSRYLARPIVRISSIAGRMAELDFQWKCGETRRDEIGALGRSLDEMAERLSAALAELEEANAALRGDMERARELERQRLAFFSAASHELKTPLTSIKGFTDMLASGMVASPEDQKRFITMIGVEVDRLIDLINDILKLSELESVTIPQSEERSDVLTIARDTAAFLTPTAKAAEVTLSVDGGPATVAVPQGRLKELLLNLVGNGIKYNEPGGTVHTAVSVRDGQAVIAVSDTGIGIPPEAQSRVFERFYRVDKGRARKNGGTGLGLAIVKHIVQLYGGTLTLESAVGKGSTFTVTLPLAKDNA